MARTVAGLPEGARVSDYITLGVLAERIPLKAIHEVLRKEGRQSRRQRRLPAHVVVYYVMALALYMEVSYGEVLRCLVEGLQWLGWPVRQLRQTGRSAISQARTRLGFEPMQRLYDELVHPIATERTRGAWYRSPAQDLSWRLVSLDGSTLDMPDEARNREVFGRPGASRGRSAFPKLRFVTLLECGTHVLFGAVQGPYKESEATLAADVIARLRPGMLCLADRYFFAFSLWKKAASPGADLLWRMKINANLPCNERLSDGSYLSKIFSSEKDRRHDRNGRIVRVIEYALDGDDEAEPFYRLMTTILDPEAAPASELAALYMERWEIETAFDEFKTHLRGRAVVLRSKTPDLVRQEFYGLLLTHYAVRGLMHEAALKADLDPDKISFVHSVRVIRRRIQETYGLATAAGPFPPSGNCDSS